MWPQKPHRADEPSRCVPSNHWPRSGVPSNHHPSSGVPSNHHPGSGVPSNRQSSSGLPSKHHPTGRVPSNRRSGSRNTVLRRFLISARITASSTGAPSSRSPPSRPSPSRSPSGDFRPTASPTTAHHAQARVSNARPFATSVHCQPTLVSNQCVLAASVC